MFYLVWLLHVNISFVGLEVVFSFTVTAAIHKERKRVSNIRNELNFLRDLTPFFSCLKIDAAISWSEGEANLPCAVRGTPSNGTSLLLYFRKQGLILFTPPTIAAASLAFSTPRLYYPATNAYSTF